MICTKAHEAGIFFNSRNSSTATMALWWSSHIEKPESVVTHHPVLYVSLIFIGHIIFIGYRLTNACVFEYLRCFTMAKCTTRGSTQKVFDIEYLTVEFGSDFRDSFEILELFQHFLSLWPMVALSCKGCVIENVPEFAVAYWFAVDFSDPSASKTHRRKQ